MTFDFTDKIPQDLHLQSILISGTGSLQFSGREYLVIDNGEKNLFEIRYEYHCSPFKQIIISDNILAVGFEENFYLFDLVTNRDNTLPENGWIIWPSLFTR